MDKPTTKVCPCCHRKMPKPRVETLKPQLVKALQQMYQASGLEFRKIPAYVFKAQHSRLKHWNLIEEQIFVKKNGTPQRRPGVWRVTEIGEEFLAGYNRQPFSLWLEKDRVILRGDDMVSCKEALGLDDSYEIESDYDRYMRGEEEV